MAKHYKILGQSAPSATTNTDVYTVPLETESVVSTITVSNRDVSAATYRIAIRSKGETISNEHYVVYNASVPGNDTIALTVGITADSEDVITVYASSSNLSFNIFGSEIT